MLSVTDIVARALGRAPEDLAVSLRPPLEHQSNRLYDVRAGGRRYIAKEYLDPDDLREAPAREHQALLLLAALDIAPQPVFYDPAAGPLVLYEYLDGAMWDRTAPAPGQLRQLADVWGAVHSATTAGLWPSRNHRQPPDAPAARMRTIFQQYHERIGARHPAGRDAVRQCAALLDERRPLLQLLVGADVPACFCRSDARFANVIQRPDGRVGLIDWEDSGLRDPARDAASLLSHPNQEDLLSDEQWRAFLDPYLVTRRPGDPGIEERIHRYGAIYPLFWLALGLQQGLRRTADGTLAGWQVNGIPGEERLRRYLARALSWPAGSYTARLASLAGLRLFPDDARE